MNDLIFVDLGTLVDMFWLGITKMGALFGEKIVINQPELAQNFAISLKQHVALLVKGQTLGVQFLPLLNDDTFSHICIHGKKLVNGLARVGYPIPYPVQSNQVFVEVLQALANTL